MINQRIPPALPTTGLCSGGRYWQIYILFCAFTRYKDKFLCRCLAAEFATAPRQLIILSRKALIPQKWLVGSLRLFRLIGLSAHICVICERLSLSPAVKGLSQKAQNSLKQVMGSHRLSGIMGFLREESGEDGLFDSEGIAGGD